MLKIYNSLTNRVENFKTITEKQVRMYVCGPTVYGDIHIGNARPVIVFDTFKRYLVAAGYEVLYVSNITDVDDKIINKAIEQNETEVLVALKYTEAYINMSKALGSKLPDQMPKATTYIGPMLKYIQKLIDTGYAYVRPTGVYFSVHKIKEYGMLSKQNIEALDESVRIQVKDEKEDPRDFNLWKQTQIGVAFNSPWGDGRPGWHTECAVMNHEIFKGKIDVHGGGSDLKFPHHENEIAQSIAHDNHNLANYWMHVGRLDFDKQKMSKSLGNVVLVKDLVQTVNPYAFRLLTLAHHYRQPINYSDELMEQYSKVFERILGATKKAALTLALHQKNDAQMIQDDLEVFYQYMNDDLNTPNVVTLVLDIVKRINKENDLDTLSGLYQTSMYILNVLGIHLNIEVSEHILYTYRMWQEARETKNYQEADKYRKVLLEQGWI